MKLYSLGALEILTIIFVAMKLAGVITWSWWAVFAPILIEFIFVIIALGFNN